MSLFQAEGSTCEDFQDEDHYSASPDSSLGPLDGNLTTTSSSLFIDSLTTEGKAGAGVAGRGPGRPIIRSPRWPSQDHPMGQAWPCPLTDEGLKPRALGSLAGEKQRQV